VTVKPFQWKSIDGDSINGEKVSGEKRKKESNIQTKNGIIKAEYFFASVDRFSSEAKLFLKLKRCRLV